MTPNYVHFEVDIRDHTNEHSHKADQSLPHKYLYFSVNVCLDFPALARQ